MRAHPENAVAKTGYAEVLKAMNRLPESFTAYQTAMHDHPENAVAKHGCACVLALLERWDEALRLLPESAPQTPDEWIGYHIRGMILLRTGAVDDAIAIFEQGVREDPRPSSADYFRTALAAAQLRKKEYEAACATLEKVTAPQAELPANVLRLHALGELRSNNAADIYRKIPRELPSNTAELRDELGRRYITHEPPLHDTEWLYQRECLMLIAA